MRKAVYILVSFFSFFLLSLFVGTQNAEAQMPVTDGIIEQCLASGGTPEQCLAEALNYLNNICGTACQGSDGGGSAGYCDGSGCYITCANGSSTDFPNPQPVPPTATPVQKPPPTATPQPPPPAVGCPSGTHVDSSL